MNHANPINIDWIDHVVLRVNQMETMLTFYCQVLGMRFERGPGESRLAQLRAGQSLVDLLEVGGPLDHRGDTLPDLASANMDHLCLRVMPWDGEAIKTHLTDHGVSFGEIGIRYGAAGPGPSIYLNDPEGNTVELKGTNL